MDLIIAAIMTGVGATAIMDLWALFLRRAFGIAPLDYALVGRWLAHMPEGCFAHRRIVAARPVAGERTLGWIAHYAIGILFADFLLLLGGTSWASSPTIGLALAVGTGTVAFPFFVMQPAFGLGIAASRLPKPNLVRIRSLVTHAIFGVGLYISASLLSIAA